MASAIDPTPTLNASLPPAQTMVTSAAIDLTPAYNVVLYCIFLESLLFSLVIMQTINVERGAHIEIARYFGLMFLFQALAAVTTALSEQFYESLLSFFFASLSVATTVLAIVVTIPASVYVAVPETERKRLQVPIGVAGVLTMIITAIFVGPILRSRPDVPYIDSALEREVLSATIGTLLVLLLSTVARMMRPIKGRNGAFILLAGLALVVAIGIVWGLFEPSCRIAVPTDPWPETCPLPRSFDHNFVLGLVIMVANVLVAEGVLRLMAAGSDFEGYVEIVPDIPTIYLDSWTPQQSI